MVPQVLHHICSSLMHYVYAIPLISSCVNHLNPFGWIFMQCPLVPRLSIIGHRNVHRLLCLSCALCNLKILIPSHEKSGDRSVLSKFMLFCCKICFVAIIMFCRKNYFVAIYALLRGEKFSQNLYLWRANIRYGCTK